MSSTPVLIWSPSGRLEPLYDAEDATRLPVNLNPYTGANTVFPYGMVLGEVLASQGLYNWLNSVTSRADGTQNPKGILEYRAQVTGTAGAAGTIAGVAPGVGGEWPGVTTLDASMFKSGDFDLSKIVGLGSGSDFLANVELLAARLVSGGPGTDAICTILPGTETSGTIGITVPSVTVNGYVYPAVVVANTTLSYAATAAQVATAINNALLVAGIPAFVTATGGALGNTGSNVVVTFHGAYGQRVVTTLVMDYTQAAGGTGGTVSITTPGVASYGIIRLG